MQFPKGFREKYQALLGPEAEDFFNSFTETAVAGFRTNPLKAGQLDFDQPIPNTLWGHYGKVSGKSLAHVTGLVYSQEPAAQMVAQVAGVQEGMKVLDLAAAPGGKTTHLLSYLNNTGLLVSNEINGKRSKILVENVERFGARNVVVLNESPERLAAVFPNYFDLIVLDAPCSGEGMFRKQPEAGDYWSPSYPSQCANLQRDILPEALKMLKPGGTLVYATCTWAPEEDEAIVDFLLEEYPLILVDVPKINGMVGGINHPEVARMYPHRFKGEGQFVAKFVYEGQSVEEKSAQKKGKKGQAAKAALTADQQKLWSDFAVGHLLVDLPGQLQVFGDQLYLLPLGLPDLSKLKIARNGLHLGTFKKNRFEPSFALGLALKPREVAQKVVLSDDQAKDYLRGLTLNLEGDYANGWYQVVVLGNGLGFAKIANGQLKNAYPKGLRLVN